MSGGSGGGGGGGGGSGWMSDQREVIDDYREMVEAAIDAKQSRIFTAIPVKISEFDKKKLTAKVQPLIKTTIREVDGTVKKKDFPEIQDAPVYFPGGGREDQGQGGQSGASTQAGGGSQKKKGYMFTLPLKEGDECIGIVSCRTIDQWYEQADVQEQGDARMHNPSDMMILPGVRSKPRAEEVEGGVDDKKAQFRSADNKHKYSVDEDMSGEGGGLSGETDAHVKYNAKKNIEHEAGENQTRTTGKVETATAGKAIIKKAPKVIINST
jgi:hypothetical protein